MRRIRNYINGIVILASLICNHSYSKTLHATYLYNIAANQCIYIDFNKNGKFQLCKDIQCTPDQLETLVLNSGFYRIVKDEILLTDKDYGIVFRFKYIDKSSIKAIKCYSSLNNRIFPFHGFPRDKEFYRNNSKKRISNIGIKLPKLKLLPGTYTCSNGCTLLMLRILPNTLFEYSLDGILLFKGTYQVNANELSLYDTCAGYKMKFYLDANKIIDNYISPGIVLDSK